MSFDFLERLRRPKLEIGQLKVKKGDILLVKFGINQDTLRSSTYNPIDNIVGTEVKVVNLSLRSVVAGGPKSLRAEVKIIRVVDEEKRRGVALGRVGEAIDIPGEYFTDENFEVIKGVK